MHMPEGVLEFARDLLRGGPTFAAQALLANRRFARSHSNYRRISRNGHEVHIRPGSSDLAVVRQVFRDSEYDLPSMRALFLQLQRAYHHILESGGVPVIIDGGANIGTASLVFERLFPEAVVLAVEPNPATVKSLLRNVKPFPNIRVCEAAIGNEDGFVELENEDLAWATSTRKSSSGVPMRSVAGLLTEVERGQLLVVKIDIEGFEDELFADHTGWLADTPCLIIELHDWMFPGQGKSRNLLRALQPHAFEIFQRGENLFFLNMNHGSTHSAICT